MSATAGDLVVNLRADASRFRKELNRGKQDLQGFAASTKNIMAKATAAFAVIYSVDRFITAYETQIRAERKLEAVIRSTGRAAKVTADEIKELAARRQELTNFGDEETIGAAALLATFKNVKQNVFRETIVLAQDMATIMEQDLRSSMLMLGKALNDPVLGLTALSRAGVQFTAQQKEQIKVLTESGKMLEAQEIILAELRSQFGGAAEAGATAWTQFKNSVGDLGETLGQGLSIIAIPLTGFLKMFNEGLDGIQEGLEWLLGVDGKEVEIGVSIAADETALGLFSALSNRGAEARQKSAESGVAEEIEKVRNQIGLVTGEVRSYDALMTELLDKGALPEHLHELEAAFKQLEEVKFAKGLEDELDAVRLQLALMKGEITEVDAAVAKFEGRGDEHKLTALRDMLTEREQLKKQLEQDELLAKRDQANLFARDPNRRSTPSSGLTFGSAEGMSAVLSRLNPSGGKRPEEETAEHTGELLKESKNFFTNFRRDQNNLLNSRQYNVANTPWQG